MELLLAHPACTPGVVHDLNIIATAQVNGIDTILTFDKDFTAFTHIISVQLLEPPEN